MFEIKDGLMVQINEADKTASIAESPKVSGNVFIPSFYENNNIKYKIISIGSSVFEKCNIDTLTFPDDSEVEIFADRCFSKANIKKLQIPAKVNKIDGSFIHINELQEIEISPNNHNFIFHNNQILLGKSNNDTSNFDILHFAMFNIEEITIPPQVAVIKEYSFYSHKQLKSIKFDANSQLKIIEKDAFSHTRIADLLFPATLEEICDESFIFTPGLKTVKFQPNSNLKKMINAFNNSKVESISLPASVQYIDDDCFSFTPNLFKLEVQEGNKFFKSINGDYIITESVKNSGVLDAILIARRNIESITIPAYIKVINNFSFQRCKNLKNIVFESNSSLEVIQSYAFCSISCEKIVFPPSLKELSSRSLFGNTKLKSVEFLSNSIILKKECLNKCAVTSIIFRNAEQITFENKALDGIPDNAKILLNKNANLSGDVSDDCRSKICSIEEEEERIQKEEEEKKRKEEEERIQKEEEEKKRKEEERIQKEKEGRIQKEEDEKKRKEEDERIQKEKEGRIQKEEEEKKRKEEKEKKRKEEEKKKKKDDDDKIKKGEREPPKKEEKPKIICPACKKPIETKQCMHYSNRPYHFECIKCSVCKKTFSKGDKKSDYVCISPGMFLCEQHYKEQQAPDAPSQIQSFMKEYDQKKKENIIEEVLNQSMLNSEDTSNYSEEEVLVTQEMVDSSIEQNQYEDILPTIALHVDKPPQEINCEKLPEVLGDDVAILGVKKNVIKKEPASSTTTKVPDEQISSIITLALLSSIATEQDQIFQEHQKYIDEFKDRLNSSIDNKAIIGNFVDAKIDNPDEKRVNQALKKPSVNQLQSSVVLNKKEIVELRKKAIEKIKKDSSQKDWNFVFSHTDLYNELEAQVRKDLEDNPYEMIMTGQTIITSKHFGEYEDIKDELKDEATERFLYHGSKLVNHFKIATGEFYNPAEDDDNKIKRKDAGYYGVGIYATDNIFYASMYANDVNTLGINEKTYVISCRSIYNKNKFEKLTDLSKNGEPIEDDIAKHYGYNTALVGNRNDYKPIPENEKDNNEIWANEYVFPHKNQFIPCLSFTVMRKDHYILWKDEKLDNSENAGYMNDLSKNMEVNIYGKKSVAEALEVIRKKKYAAVKLMTNAGENLTGKDLIIKAREIVGSDFVCLVFAGSKGHMEWISKMKNVILTTDSDEFKEFAALKMNVVSVLNFIEKIRGKYETRDYKFQIDEESLLKFPNCENEPYYRNYNYRNPIKGILKKIFSKFW